VRHSYSEQRVTGTGSHDARPLVSVTSAFFNTGPFLLDMIKSILAQTFTDWELVLLDDGSTDGSLALVQSVADPRVRVFTNGTNRGRSFSLNRLTGLARGRYIARMDSDDLSAPRRLARQVEFLERHADVDAVGTEVVYISRDCIPMGQRRFPATHAEICRTPLHYFGIGHGTILARRTWFERFRYDESINLAVDANLFLCTYAQSTFANIAEPLYYYRFEPSFQLRKQLVTRRIMARYFFDYCRRNGRFDQALWLAAAQCAKAAATILLFASGFQGRLFRRRFEPLNAEQSAEHVRTLEQIRNLPIMLRDRSESAGRCVAGEPAG
jgi:glycosyltransferase involved in cell wall biosynthesis